MLDGRELRVQMARYGRPSSPTRSSSGRRGGGGGGGSGGRRRSRSRSQCAVVRAVRVADHTPVPARLVATRRNADPNFHAVQYAATAAMESEADLEDWPQPRLVVAVAPRYRRHVPFSGSAR